MTTNEYGFGAYSTTFSVGTTSVPLKETPKTLLGTKVAQVAAGHIGQVVVNGQIVWESDPQPYAEDAAFSASEKVTEAVGALFKKGAKK